MERELIEFIIAPFIILGGLFICGLILDYQQGILFKKGGGGDWWQT